MLRLQAKRRLQSLLSTQRAASASANEPVHVEVDAEEQPSTKPLKTNLNQVHRETAEGRIPPLLYDYQKEKWAQAERFGRYGLASGVDIRKLWPSVEEVEEIKALRMHRSAQEAMKIAMAAKENEKQKVIDRMAEIERNFAQHPGKLKAFEDSQVQAEAEQDEKAKQLEKRIREIQEYFGYWIDPNDPRFEVMLKQKEAEEKKAAKQAKKQEVLRRSIASVVSGES